MLNELMLYTPYREEQLDDYENNCAEIYMQKENYIKIVISKVMEHLESIEEARWIMEEAKKELDIEKVNDNHGRDIFKKIIIPDKNVLRTESRNLDKFQREAINIGIKYT